MKRIDALLFDLDGTIWNTIDTCVDTWLDVMQRNRLLQTGIGRQSIISIMGKSHADILNVLFPGIDAAIADTCLKACYKAHQAAISQGNFQLYPGVVETLNDLANHFPIHIISNCDRNYMDLFRQLNGAKIPIIDTLCHGDTGRSKAENIRELMDRNGIHSSVYVGDTMTDAIAARDAELPFIYASYGFGYVPKAEYSISDISELPALLVQHGFDQTDGDQ